MILRQHADHSSWFQLVLYTEDIVYIDFSYHIRSISDSLDLELLASTHNQYIRRALGILKMHEDQAYQNQKLSRISHSKSMFCLDLFPLHQQLLRIFSFWLLPELPLDQYSL